MTQLLKYLLTAVSKELLKVLLSALDVVKAFFSFKSSKHKNELLKEQNKQKEQFKNAVDKAVDKGSIEDLLNLRR